MCHLSVFLFAKRDPIRLRNTPAKFCEVTLSRYRVMFELGENRVILIYGAFLKGFLYFFFAKRNLIRLRNMLAKFHEVALRRYGVMLHQ